MVGRGRVGRARWRKGRRGAQAAGCAEQELRLFAVPRHDPGPARRGAYSVRSAAYRALSCVT
eukprot:755734-Rhodomonas_salina.1